MEIGNPSMVTTGVNEPSCSMRYPFKAPELGGMGIVKGASAPIGLATYRNLPFAVISSSIGSLKGPPVSAAKDARRDNLPSGETLKDETDPLPLLVVYAKWPSGVNRTQHATVCSVGTATLIGSSLPSSVSS